jgi:hypothetical protein
LRRTKLTLPGLFLVLVLSAGALLSINGQMPLGKQTSNVTRDFLIGDGSMLEPSFLVITLYVVALILNMLFNRWAIVGTLGLLAAGLINTAGELIGQPVAFGVLGLEFGVVPAALLALQVLTAAVVIVLAVWELVVRVRNRGRLSTLAA